MLLHRIDLAKHATLVDAIRGTAAILVLLSHADAYRLIWIDELAATKHWLGAIGVYLFFIASGYLIWTSAQKSLPRQAGLQQYAVHRLTRILPLYLVSIAFVIWGLPFFQTVFKPDITTETVIRHLTLTQSLNPNVARALNPVLWTLTHEAIFYCVVPILFFARAPVWLICIGAAVACAWGWTYQAQTLSPFLMNAHLFAVGIAMAHYRAVPGWLPALGLAALAALLHAAGAGFIWPSMVAAIALFAAFANMARISRWLAPLAWTGVVSYSLYIWHYLLVEIVGPMLLPPTLAEHSLERPAIFIAVVIAVSAASYFAIERPGMTSLRRLLLRRSGQLAQPAGEGKPRGAS